MPSTAWRLLVCAGVVVLLGAIELSGYESYHDPALDDVGYCANCHPTFGEGPDGELHLHHTGDPDPATDNCDLCHTGSGRDNPLTMWSIGGDQQGCAGCHGRDYGETIEDDYRNFPITGLAKSSTYGLRQRHAAVGVTLCFDCHEELSQDEILAESVNPIYFARADVGLGGMPMDSCTNDETDNDPDDFGLDHDGDLFYGLDDLDCQDGPELTVSGICPGELTVSITEATPGATVGILVGDAAGSFRFPSGDCEGIELGIDDPQVLTTAVADAGGAIEIVRQAPAMACGMLLEAVDLVSCQASPAVVVQ